MKCKKQSMQKILLDLKYNLKTQNQNIVSFDIP